MNILVVSLKDYKKRYIEECDDVARFVGMSDGSLVLNDLIIDKEALFVPKFRLEPNFDSKESKVTGSLGKRISILPAWRRVLMFPVAFFADTFKHESRHAAHYALVDRVYDNDPELAHKVLVEEKTHAYKIYRNLSIKTGKRNLWNLAGHLLQQNMLSRAEMDIEKMAHYGSITYGLQESFADQNNTLRNLYFGFATGSLGTLAFVDPMVGMLLTFTSMVLGPRYYYRNSKSLTPKNLQRFTPLERRHLLAFPSDYKPLEKRCEELKDYGFPL